MSTDRREDTTDRQRMETWAKRKATGRPSTGWPPRFILGKRKTFDRAHMILKFYDEGHTWDEADRLARRVVP
jgi:hypothetical protein